MKKQKNMLGIFALLFAFLFIAGVIGSVLGYESHEEKTSHPTTITEETKHAEKAPATQEHTEETQEASH